MVIQLTSHSISDNQFPKIGKRLRIRTQGLQPISLRWQDPRKKNCNSPLADLSRARHHIGLNDAAELINKVIDIPKHLPILALPALILLISVSSVYAPWSTLGTGYAITSNYHGREVPPSAVVAVTAGTLDPSVTHVTFRWHRPDDTVVREVTVPVFTNGTIGEWNNGDTALIRYAMDNFKPEVLGDWGVQAFFRDSAGKQKAGLNNVIKIKATSFNVVPEVPFGTAAIVLSMFGALGILAIRKKRL